MQQIRTAAFFASIYVATLVRRLFRGPARPTWTQLYETFARFMQAEAEFMMTLDAPAARARLHAQSKPTTLRRSLRCEGELFRGPAGVVVAEWFRPPDLGPESDVLLYLHGGGYVFGSIRSHEDFVARLAVATGAAVLAVEYRLAPENPFPAGRDDAIQVIQMLYDRGLNPDHLLIAGDSAGAGLSLQVMNRLRDLKLPLPRAAVLLSPWTDLACESQSFDDNDRFDYVHRDGIRRARTAYHADFRSPEVSVVHANLDGLPPLFIMAGDAEMLRDDSVRLADQAKAHGVDVTLEIWPDMIHAWPQFAFLLPEARQAVVSIAAWLHEHPAAQRRSVEAPSQT